MKNKIIIRVFICTLVFVVIFWLFLRGSENGGERSESNKDKVMETSIPKGSDNQRSVKLGEPRSDREILEKKNPIFKPVNNLERLKFSDFGLKHIEAIKKSINSGSGNALGKSTENGKPHKTVTEAFERIFKNVSMTRGSVPEKYFDDDEFFYFSDGQTGGEILDFTFGIAVSKKDGSMVSWRMDPSKLSPKKSQ